MIRQIIKVSLLVFLTPLMAFSIPEYEDIALMSFADHLHMTRSKDPVDGGWLPDLTGLPGPDQVPLLTKQMVDVISEDKDGRCTSINMHLRMLIFQHFVLYQQMANAQQIYLDEKLAHKWAHVFAMVLKESSGDSTSITDMSGRSISTYKPKTDIQHWNEILNLTQQSRIKLNYQTNFGLSQTSADRLFDAFHLAQNQKYDTTFLEGREGASTPRKISLNTAIAIRRLIWFYQDFAQGRTSQLEGRIHYDDILKPEFSKRYKTGLKLALLYCGTQFMFRDGDHNTEEQQALKLEEAMASIAYCKLGNSQKGYGKNEFDERCFAEWVTLCPTLNIDIAMLTPLSYFATRGESPVCEETFKRLIIKKPAS